MCFEWRSVANENVNDLKDWTHLHADIILIGFDLPPKPLPAIVRPIYIRVDAIHLCSSVLCNYTQIAREL